MAIKKYLNDPSTQTVVDKIIADIYPILREHCEQKGVSPWELATALVMLLSSVTSNSDLDREMLVQLTSFIMETTPDQGLFSTKH
jgi:hypothetical protein|tara:strand:- start:24 stop:278 length:255 start_codon:yes stop_codon:yes gene_type:complete